MVKVNRSAYDLASSAIESGRWRVDVDAGVIYGMAGGPIGSQTKEGYVLVKPSQELRVMAHRVIWEAAYGPIDETLEVNHINGVKSDNRIANLELVTHAGNMEHARETGLIPEWVFTPKPKPIRAPRRAATPATSCETHGTSEWRLRKDRPGRGWCRACNRISTAKWRAAKQAA